MATVFEERSASSDLVDTGVSLTFYLRTDWVTPEEAAVFFWFLNEVIKAHSKLWESLPENERIIPVVEIYNGSIKVIIRFLQEKIEKGGKLALEGAKDFTKDVAKETAKLVAALILASVLAAPGTAKDPELPPGEPTHIAETAKHTVDNDLKTVIEVFEKSGKPFTIEVDEKVDGARSETRIIIHGNDSAS